MKRVTTTKPNKIRDKFDGVVISKDTIKSPEDNDSILLCSYCNCNAVVKLRDFSNNNSTLFCKRCNVSLEDDSIRKESKLGTQIKEIEPAATSIGYDAEGEITLHKPVPLRGAFKSLSEKGNIHFTSYSTTEKE